MKFNKNIKRLSSMASALMVFSMITVSCSKDDDKQMETTGTISAMVSMNKDYSILASAVTKAGLGETLSSTGPFTVFAPNNAAFESSGMTSADISSMSAESLKSVLLYHTLSAKVVASSVPAGPNAEVKTANGSNVYVTKNSKGVFVNGWAVTSPDMMATNGVIHGISHVLMPATKNIVALATANSDLSFLVAAVLRASQGTTNVAQLLSGSGPYTVFAPTNQAFINAGFTTIASINQADPAALTKILTYHVLSARAFSSDLSDGQMLSTLNGEKITVKLSGKAMLKGKSNTSESTITGVNMLATNGVVHVIDQVLLP
ncbi:MULTISPECIES: fasciclin domain-containing protein [unclassified Sphingobacterium]|uniref:fasciclin domain-containing protein n=1 Tax=unclassified Sphingobacterium TaxID=2609468 RepID=UPI0025E291C2|nr:MULTISPECIES: fasciclin domain-containing protein [unclassified Sphingobacterium]